MGDVAGIMTEGTSRPAVQLGQSLDSALVEFFLPQHSRTVAWKDVSDSQFEPSPELVLVDFRELALQEQAFRFRVLTNLCLAGTEIWVIDPDARFEAGTVDALLIDQSPRIREVLSTIRRVVPFDLELLGIDSGPGGTSCCRFVCKKIFSAPQEQPNLGLFTLSDLANIYVGEGFYPIEAAGYGHYSWLREAGTIWIESSRELLLHVSLEIAPLAMRPQSVVFNGTSFPATIPTAVSTYVSVIPGLNPLKLSFEGLLLSPQELGISNDTRKVSVRLTGATLRLLS